MVEGKVLVEGNQAIALVALMGGTLELVSYPPEVDYNAVLAIDPDGRVQLVVDHLDLLRGLEQPFRCLDWYKTL